VPATTQYCESQPSEFAPPPSVVARSAGTNYRLHLTLDGSFVPGTNQIYNNHIPLDLNLDQSISLTKTTPLVNVSRGQLVPYVITVANGIGVNLTDVSVVDRFPAGFRYIVGSARLDGVAAEPTVNATGRELSWQGLSVTADGRHTLMLLLGVGSGVGEGEFTNRAQAMSSATGRAISGEASATVRIVPDPDFDCTDVIGKVFDDANRNGLQDADERGLGGVRLATARGLLAVTDQYGRFHITCAITPREGRGTNFVLKLDDRTLPSGYRASPYLRPFISSPGSAAHVRSLIRWRSAKRLSSCVRARFRIARLCCAVWLPSWSGSLRTHARPASCCARSGWMRARECSMACASWRCTACNR
jgi:uncharacterized repeat protein (TIGR01451 family)